MDIASDVLAVQARIADLTGAAPAPLAPPVAPATASASAPDGLPVLDPSQLAGTPFAALVQAAMAGQGVQPAVDGDGIAYAGAAAQSAPSMVPPAEIDRLVSSNAAQWNVDPNLVKAIIANESGFNA